MMCVCLCAENVATLFRASTLATMLMDQLMKLTAMDYLHSVLREPIQRIADLRDSCEVGVVDAVNVIFYASVSKLYSTARNLCVVYIIMPVRLSFASTACLHTVHSKCHIVYLQVRVAFRACMQGGGDSTQFCSTPIPTGFR